MTGQPTAGVALKPCPADHIVYASMGHGACPYCHASLEAIRAEFTRTPASGAVEAMARRLHAADVIARNEGRPENERLNLDGANLDDWYAKSASMPLSGPGFVAYWTAMALAALTSSPKAEGEIAGWFWRVRGVEGRFRSDGPARPSFSFGQPGEVYDLQPIYADAAPQPRTTKEG